MPTNKNEFEACNMLCQSILDEYDRYSDMHHWLSNHRTLFNRINIQPIGLPGIANANFGGVRYASISKFHRLFKKVEFEYHILEEKTHKDAIIYFLEEMDLHMIRYYLHSNQLMGIEQEAFFCLLENALNELRNRGNTNLKVSSSFCNSCNKNQYFFVGNADGSYLHFNFTILDDVITDIQECTLFRCLVPIELDTEKRVFVNVDVTPF